MKQTFRPTLVIALCALLALAPITAAAQDTPGTVKFPTSADTADSLIRAANSARSTLSAPITSSATTVAVVSAASFPASGAAVIDNEIIFYTGKTSTTLTGVVRGADSTAAAAHSSGAAVRGVIAAAHHNTLAATIIALQAKLGLGAFTPGSGTFLKGTGTGSSTWGAISAGDVPALDASKITTGTLPDARIASAAAWNAKQAALGFTPLNPANSLSEVASAAEARTNLGLGTISTQSAASVNVTGGTLANVTCTDCTSLGSGTAGGVVNTGDTVIGSDTEANGVGDVLIQTGGVTRLKFKADGTVEGTANLFKRIDVQSYGAVGDGVADDTAAFASAVTACNTAGGCVFYVPRGKFKTAGGFVFTVPVTLRGDGVANNGDSAYLSRVECTSPTAYLFTFAALTSHVEGVSLVNTSGTTPTAGAAIRATHASASYARVTYSNVWVANFWDNIFQEAGANWTMQSVINIDPVRYGVHVDNVVDEDAGDWTISASSFVASTRAPVAAIFIEGSGGGRISNIKVVGDYAPGAPNFDYGILTTPVLNTGILKISDASIESVNLVGIKVVGWSRVDVSDYQFGIYKAASTAYAMLYDGVTDSGYDNITSYTLTGAGAPAVVLNNCARISKGRIQATGFSPWLSVTGTYAETGYVHNNGWTNVTFQNGWSNLNAGYVTCQYALQNDLVRVKCAAQAGTVSAVMFNLPLGYRPAEDFFVPTYEGGAAKFVKIDSSGNVTHAGASNGSVIFNAIFAPK